MDLPILTQKQQAHIFATGLLALLILGSLSLAALVFVATWAVCALASVILLSLIATLASVQAAYVALNPIMQLVTLLVLAGVPTVLVARLKASRRSVV